MREVVLSLVASVIAGSAVWLVQRLLNYRRMARKRAFFGVSAGASCVLVAPRHFSSPQTDSVHRRDMAALVELATAHLRAVLPGVRIESRTPMRAARRQAQTRLGSARAFDSVVIAPCRPRSLTR
jgi:hypothetical protein